MSEIDAFASLLLEQGKRFLERAGESTDDDSQLANLHAALALSFCSLEAHINSIAADIALRPDLSPHQQGMLLERDVTVEKGTFVVGKRLKIHRLEDRLLLLHRLGSKPDIDGAWRAPLGTALDLRNKLSHPKAAQSIKMNDVTKAVQAVIDTLTALYGAYKKKFPAAQRKLISTLSF